MKHTIAFFVALLATPFLFGQTHLTYRDVPLDGTLDRVISVLQGKGLEYTGAISENMVQMGYLSNGQPIDVMVVSNPETGKVFRVVVLTQPKSKWRSLRKEYGVYKKQLMAQYGEPTTYELFLYPYDTKKKQRRRQMQALHEEKAMCSSFFHVTDDEGQPLGDITLTISPYAHLARVAIYYNDTLNAPLEDNN